jgi:hypothetical protein
MITDYSNDGKIEDLADPLFDCIGKYLYDLVNTSCLK